MAELIIEDKDATESDWQTLLHSFLQSWKKYKQRYSLIKLQEAYESNKLAVGIEEVWKAAQERRPVLLVVEEEYYFPSYFGPHNDFVYAEAVPIHSAIKVGDAVGDAIEKVLINGGDVELVPRGMLQDLMHIALILA